MLGLLVVLSVVVFSEAGAAPQIMFTQAYSDDKCGDLIYALASAEGACVNITCKGNSGIYMSSSCLSDWSQVSGELGKGQFVNITMFSGKACAFSGIEMMAFAPTGCFDTSNTKKSLDAYENLYPNTDISGVREFLLRGESYDAASSASAATLKLACKGSSAQVTACTGSKCSGTCQSVTVDNTCQQFPGGSGFVLLSCIGHHGLSGGAKVGIALGILIPLCIILAVIAFIMFRRRNSSHHYSAVSQ